MKRIIIILALIVALPQQVLAISQKDSRSSRRSAPFYDEDDSPLVCYGGGTVPSTLPASVPEPYRSIFTRAANDTPNANLPLIAAIFYAGEHAMNWPEPPPPYGSGPRWKTSPAGANGPFQFLISTWNGVPSKGAPGWGRDGNGDGIKDVQDLTDASYAAATYLVELGGTATAPDGPVGQPSIMNAIKVYNGGPGPIEPGENQRYVDRTFPAYKAFASGSAPLTETPTSEPSSPAGGTCGGLGISEDGFVFPLKTTKKVIEGGTDGSPLTAADNWCRESQSNCHHDYNAADIFAPTGTTVVAARGGTVLSVGSDPVNVRIKGEDGLWYYYTHSLAGSAKVRTGDTVTAGQELTLVGTDADAQGTPAHVHLDVSGIDNGFTRNGECARNGTCPKVSYLINPQPALIKAYAGLPEQ